MRIVILCDAYFPSSTSAAIQLKHLADQFSRIGHDVTVLVAHPVIRVPWKIDFIDGAKVISLSCLRSKNVGNLRRGFAEISMPFIMALNFLRSPLCGDRFDVVIWYSPTIFLAPLAWLLKKKSGCKSYLILRDIFPQWVLDLGMINKGITYYFFKIFEYLQYELSDVIGVQSPGNKVFLKNYLSKTTLLNNWISDCLPNHNNAFLTPSNFFNRKIFIYSGNLGLAQDAKPLLVLAKEFEYDINVGFLFIGRGSEFDKFRDSEIWGCLSNVMFMNEVSHAELREIYKKCYAGLIALSYLHTTHNIPGKFISYMQAGLPVLASVNENNDLRKLIECNDVGFSCVNSSLGELRTVFIKMLKSDNRHHAMRLNARSLYLKKYTSEMAANTILEQLSGAR